MVIGGYFLYEMIKNNKINSDAEDAVTEFEQSIVENKPQDEDNQEEQNRQENNTVQETNTNNKKVTSQGYTWGTTYKGFKVSGVIEIPKINLRYPVLTEETRKSIEVAVAILAGPRY